MLLGTLRSRYLPGRFVCVLVKYWWLVRVRVSRKESVCLHLCVYAIMYELTEEGDHTCACISSTSVIDSIGDCRVHSLAEHFLHECLPRKTKKLAHAPFNHGNGR